MLSRLRTGFGEFWRVMGIEHAIFLYLESLGKRLFFVMAKENFWIFVWKTFKNISYNGYSMVLY